MARSYARRPIRYNPPVKLRLPFDSPLPERTLPKIGVLAMLAAGGLVALLVPIVFAIVLYELVRG
jgi:hypothetical protein